MLVCVCVYMDVHMCVYIYTMACMRRSEDNLGEWVLSFHHVGPGDQTQIVRFGGKYPYWLSHLTGPNRHLCEAAFVQSGKSFIFLAWREAQSTKLDAWQKITDRTFCLCFQGLQTFLSLKIRVLQIHFWSPLYPYITTFP